ncbi:hypothetical protein M758_11G080200 [Ceratodon purpureus]|nr:hypothetical protein M758_11G080200 [Ceratodon purpureus]
MESVLFSVALEMLVSRLIDNLRRSMKCKTECKKLEQVVGKNRPKLERLAMGLDESKKNGQVWVALDEWCVDMRDLLVGANEIVHECQSGSRPFNLVFSARLATRLQEFRLRIEEKLNHTTVLETILEGSANALQLQAHRPAAAANTLQQCQCTALQVDGRFPAANTTQHGHCMVQTTFTVASSPTGIETMQQSSPGWDQQSSPGWNEHFSGASPDPGSSQEESSGTSHPHHSHPTIVGISSVDEDRSLRNYYQWRRDSRTQIRAQQQRMREMGIPPSKFWDSP